jgi:hypothetical protein
MLLFPLKRNFVYIFYNSLRNIKKIFKILSGSLNVFITDLYLFNRILTIYLDCMRF